jgi:hypothetical protein
MLKHLFLMEKGFFCGKPYGPKEGILPMWFWADSEDFCGKPHLTSTETFLHENIDGNIFPSVIYKHYKHYKLI